MEVLKGDDLGIGHPAILKMQVFAAVITEREEMLRKYVEFYPQKHPISSSGSNSPDLTG